MVDKINKYLIALILIFAYASLFAQAGEWEDNTGISTWTNGKVGIGTTTPNELLHITDDGNPKILIEDTLGDNQVGIRYKSTSYEWIAGLHGGANKFKISQSGGFGTNDYLTIDGDGKIGIGTTEPGKNLEVNSADANFGIKITSSDQYAGITFSDNTSTDDYNAIYADGNNIGFEVNNIQNAMYLHASGHIGVGTTTPNELLHIADSGNPKILIEDTLGNNQVGIRYKTTSYEWIAGLHGGVNKFKISQSSDLGTNDYLTIDSDGKVGIGTTSAGSYKLAVNGSIGAEEIEVKQDIPDYVFEKKYNLRSLDELENYIEAEKHLPDIPSAKEFEGKSVPIGKMQEKHLQKIEELTLYLIDLNKRISKLEEENNKFKKQLSVLEN